MIKPHTMIIPKIGINNPNKRRKIDYDQNRNNNINIHNNKRLMVSKGNGHKTENMISREQYDELKKENEKLSKENEKLTKEKNKYEDQILNIQKSHNNAITKMSMM